MDIKINTIRQLINLAEFDEAERFLTEALNQNPNSVELLNLKAELSLKLGSTLWEKGEIDRSLDYLINALEINPNNREIVLKCGEVLTTLEQIESAKNLYEAYLKKNPDDEEIAHALKGIEKISIPLKHKDIEVDVADKKIKVSAIVSTYNSERFMHGCLEDLVNQTLYQKGELEIVVIDSGSQQNEKNIVDQFRKRFKNIVYLRTKRETIYASWNRGIKIASGKYITNANTDDRHRSDALEVMSEILDQNPHIGLIYADVIVTATENETFSKHTPIGTFRQPDYSRELLTLQCFIGPQPMWRKSLHKKYGFFDKSFTSSGDWEFWLRIAEGTNMLHIPELLGLFLHSSKIAEYRNIEKRAKEDITIFSKYIPRYLGTVQDIKRAMLTAQTFEQKGFLCLNYARIKNILSFLMSQAITKPERV
ncbi:MAG: glycosyltransferase [Nitrospirae bacterium]|nr:glycosyltransferase [Nitrospirota bacterium]